MRQPDATVVATFAQHTDALRAVERLSSAGISSQAITLRQTQSALLESFLPEGQRSGNSTVEVRGRQSAAAAGPILRASGAREVQGDLEMQTPTSVKTQTPNHEITDAKARIEAACIDMNQTIVAIEDRLNPQAVKARVKHAVKEATVGQVERKIDEVRHNINDRSGGVMERIRQNPMPAALAGIGLTWLFMSKKAGGSSQRQYYRPGSAYQPGYGYDGRNYQSQPGGIAQAPGRVADKAGEVAGQMGSTIADTAGQVGSTIGDTAGMVGSTVGDTAAHVGQTVGSAADGVRSTTSQLASQAGHQVKRVQTNLQRSMEENPLPVGLAVLGLGAMVAMMVPKTSTEDRLLGETRDRLADTAQDVTEKVSRVAQRAGAAAQEEAHKQSLA